MTFFQDIKQYSPQLTDRECSDRLNKMENELFDAVPWLLELDEEKQNQIVEYIYKLSI
jgi:hypothetical protein